MAQTSVLALAALCALLISGTGRPEAPALAATASSAEPAFDREDVARFLEQVNSALSPGQVERISSAVMSNANRFGLDPMLVTQVLWVESGARPWVRSPLGAIGLMQVMPYMADSLGMVGNPTTIEANVEAGCRILADNISRLGEEDGISAYFWGSRIRGSRYLQRVRAARDTVRRLTES